MLSVACFFFDFMTVTTVTNEPVDLHTWDLVQKYMTAATNFIVVFIAHNYKQGGRRCKILYQKFNVGKNLNEVICLSTQNTTATTTTTITVAGTTTIYNNNNNKNNNYNLTNVQAPNYTATPLWLDRTSICTLVFEKRVLRKIFVPKREER
jgi:hypothetical protein